MNLKKLIFYIYIVSFFIHTICGFLEYKRKYTKSILYIVLFFMLGHLSGLATSLINEKLKFMELPSAYPEKKSYMYASLDFIGLVVFIITCFKLYQGQVTRLLRITNIIIGLMIGMLCFYKNYSFLMN